MLKHKDDKYFTFQRNLIFQGDLPQTKLIKKCQIYFDQQKNSIDFSHTFHHLEKKHPEILQLLANTQLFYIDQVEKKNHFLGNFPLEQEASVYFDNWETPNITLSCRSLNKQKFSQQKFVEPSKKSKERTIAQARKCVQQWKQFKKSEEKGKPLTRRSAAKIVGEKMKTLDDYARYLRLGEKFGFDFQNNSDQKISTLRSFVKEKKKQALQNPDIYWQTQEFQNKQYD